MKDFQLRILGQCWIDDDPNNDSDLCSHGQIYLRVNFQEILTELDGDWTVSTSMLLLLRTLFEDYDFNDEPSLILCCGMLMMASCPVSVGWRVKHKEKRVLIDKIRKCPTTNISDTIEFPKASIELELGEYAAPILKCAVDVADFFQKSKERKPIDAYDKKEYEKFWEEFTELKTKANGIVRI
ncbi:MAG: hypothetical protein A2Z25_06395 [Planctomycetes bacterium RBG_16_55_9]|nr:MAG: hypothetical protein A2Z25_06395 [Planctomycetes bacterium RBG_16_55_9]